MIRRPPRSTQGVSSAASDVYKRQEIRMHPSEIIDAKQLMMMATEHLKFTCMPADTLMICEIAYLQLNREALFEGIGALAL